MGHQRGLSLAVLKGWGTIRMNKLLLAYAATALVMLALDMLWLGVIAKPLYQQGIGHLMAEKPILPIAALFYAMYPVGLMIFAVVPHAAAEWHRALLAGALFGFFAYATYDLTNLATLKNWPWGLALLDIAWGTAVSGVAVVVGRVVYLR